MKAGTTKAKNTRNNIQIVLRSDLRSGSKHGYLNEVPGALPQLKRGGDRFPISRTTPRSPGLELSSLPNAAPSATFTYHVGISTKPLCALATCGQHRY